MTDLLVRCDPRADGGAEEEEVATLDDVLRSLNLPHALASLYVHIASPRVPFSLERLVFRALVDVCVDGERVTFADERVTAVVVKQWTYHRVDGLVASSLGDVVSSVDALVAEYAFRERHQRAQDHLRYAEKCVRGVYVASPEPPSSPASYD